MGDMRGERTKELLRETLRAILQVKPLEKVTVKEVLDGASVSKKAFYNHYADIYDLAIDAFLVPPERYRFEYRPLDEYADIVELCGDVLTSVARGLEFARAYPNLARAVSFNMGRSPYFDRTQMDGGIIFLADCAMHFTKAAASRSSTKTFARGMSSTGRPASSESECAPVWSRTRNRWQSSVWPSTCSASRSWPAMASTPRCWRLSRGGTSRGVRRWA